MPPRLQAHWTWLPDEVVQYLFEHAAPLTLLPILARLEVRCCRLHAVRLTKVRPLMEPPFRLMLAREQVLGIMPSSFATSALLYDKHLTDAHAATLAAGVAAGALCACKDLYLHGNEIGNAGITALAEAFTVGSKNVGVLTLDSNYIGDSGVCALVRACLCGALPLLRTLLLANNPIGDGGLNALCKAEIGGALKQLEYMSFGKRFAQHFFGDHEHQSYGDDGVRALAAALDNGAFPALKRLRVFGLEICASETRRALSAASERRHIVVYTE